jgi:hypothetical protein
MSSQSFKFSKAAYLFDILISYCFLNSSSCKLPEILSFRFKYMCVLFSYCLCFPKFFKHQITVGSVERLFIEDAPVPSPICQYVVGLVVSLPVRRGLFMNVLVREQCVLKF